MKRSRSFGIIFIGVALLVTLWQGACSQNTTSPSSRGAPDNGSVLSCGDQLLGGFGQMDPYSGSPLHNTTWKAFRFQAKTSGDAGCVKVFLKDLIGDRTDDEVGVAIYDDNAGEIGNIKAWGYREHYDWTEIGTWEYHPISLNHVETNRTITSGEHYWVTIHSSGREKVLIERGRSYIPGCDALKRGARQYAVSPPPAGFSYNIVYNNGCYGWSVW